MIDFSVIYNTDNVIILTKAPSVAIRPFLLLQIFSPFVSWFALCVLVRGRSFRSSFDNVFGCVWECFWSDYDYAFVWITLLNMYNTSFATEPRLLLVVVLYTSIHPTILLTIYPFIHPSIQLCYIPPPPTHTHACTFDRSRSVTLVRSSGVAEPLRGDRDNRGGGRVAPESAVDAGPEGGTGSSKRSGLLCGVPQDDCLQRFVSFASSLPVFVSHLFPCFSPSPLFLLLPLNILPFSFL